ncbi:uncharacterized protein LOC134183505 [Corticium candelabrum]|uniref:uncharacterized protein LOC134183505 n=1 Tax=Corticium candelabrum TaxID=121492 RepID=UPI002E25FEB0|nr:uncharacterized protein LOC134183505 [Corticium candelabrum]
MADCRPPLSKLVFKKFDVDGSGFIDAKELGRMAYYLGYKLTEGEILAAIDKLDKNGDGKINCEEFSEWWKEGDDTRFSQLDLPEKSEKELKDAIDLFKYYDTDMSGYIDCKEFKAVHENLKTSYSMTDSCDEAKKQMDKNSDGKISLQEFVSWLLRNNIINA